MASLKPSSKSVLNWHWPIICYLSYGFLCFGLAFIMEQQRYWLIPILTTIILTSTFPVSLFLFAPTVITGKFRYYVRACVGIVTVIFGLWHVASFVRYMDQGHGVTLIDIYSSFQEPQTAGLIKSLVLSWKTVFSLVLLSLVLVISWLVVRKMSQQRAKASIIAIIIVGMSLSVLFSSKIIRHDETKNYVNNFSRPAMAPWGMPSLSFFSQIGESTSRETANPNKELAEALANSAIGCEWSSPGSENIKKIKARYLGRDIIVVLLESHRLSDIEPFGIGAASHLDLCPNITAFSRESISFTNYIQAGHGTIWALYSLITGLTPPVTLTTHDGAGKNTGNTLVQTGPLKKFVNLGYNCDFLVGCEHTLWDLNSMLMPIGVSGPLSEKECEWLKQEPRSFWGFDDDAIYKTALRRLSEPQTEGRPRLQIIKTSSNHVPFLFRDKINGKEMAMDHKGGMRYADDRFGAFVDQIKKIKKDKRPIIVVTGDHGHSQRLENTSPLSILSLEAIRVPGFICFPDGYGAGELFDDLISHQDLLSLLSLIVSKDQGENPEKFIDRHRNYLSFVQSIDYAIITKDNYMPTWGNTQERTVYKIDDYWSLKKEDSQTTVNDMKEKAIKATAEHGRLWNINEK